MNFRGDNFFNSNRRNFPDNFDNDSLFKNFNSSDNFRRQRSPIFNDHLNNNQTTSLRSRFFENNKNNFDSDRTNQNKNQKVYHVPIHIEGKDEDYKPMNFTVNNNEKTIETNLDEIKDDFTDSPQQVTTLHNVPKPSKIHYIKIENENLENNLINPKDNNLDNLKNNNLSKNLNELDSLPVKTCKPGHQNSKNQNIDLNKNDNENLNKDNENLNENTEKQTENTNFNEINSKSEKNEDTDLLSLVEKILQEVESYENEIDNFSGQYLDKQYRYLDEYLTRCMLKLDNIDTSGNSNLKQARKNALNYINKVITKLENLEKTKSQDKLKKDASPENPNN